MQDVFRPTMNDGMAGVVSTLTAHDNVRVRSENIDDLPLSFIAPLRPDQDCVRHNRWAKNFPDASGGRIRDYRQTIGSEPSPARAFGVEAVAAATAKYIASRSEEHTSELQS